MVKRALIAVTSTEKFPNTDKAIGLWLGQAAHFYNQLSKYGWHIDFVSPKGGYTPLEPESLQLGTNEIDWKMYADPVFRDKLAKTHKPSELDSSHYDCMFFTGGHGVVFDFYKNKELEELAQKIFQRGGIVAAVCHGVVALLNLKLSNGQCILKNRNVTGFANSEEKEVKYDKYVPFLIEDAIKDIGGVYSKSDNWTSHCVVDGRVITGQNNHSTDAVAKAVLQIKI